MKRNVISSIPVMLSTIFVAMSVHGSAIRTTDIIDFKGNNVTTDSFDSSDFGHSTAGGYPFGAPEKTLSGGDVLTTSTGINSIRLGNALIKGRLATGPGGTVSIGPSGSVSGPITDDMNTVYPSASIPAGFNGGGIIYNNLNVNGVTYAKAIISSGDYILTSLSGSLYVGSPNLGSNISYRIKITGSVSLNGTNDQIRIASNASVKIYMAGASFAVKGKGIVNENLKPDSLMYFGLPAHTSLALTGSFTGVIYAPQAAFTFGSAENGGQEFVGGLMTKSLALNGVANFHFDRALYNTGPFPPRITNQPQSLTVLVGSSATFSGSGIGSGPLGYQWLFRTNPASGWMPIANATNATLTLTNVDSSQAGLYALSITNAFGSTTSSEASLTISPSPVLAVISRNPFEFSVSGLSEGSYAVESSTNLIDWERMVTNTVPFSITDTNLDALPRRFYRAVYLP